MYLKPAPVREGREELRRVPDPDTGGYLADMGKEIIANHTYWWRRLEDGDCVIPTNTSASVPPKPTKKKET